MSVEHGVYYGVVGLHYPARFMHQIDDLRERSVPLKRVAIDGTQHWSQASCNVWLRALNRILRQSCRDYRVYGVKEGKRELTIECRDLGLFELVRDPEYAGHD